MDPILSAFLVAAGVAISFLIIANIYIYVEYHNVQKNEDSCTQTVSTQYQTVSTHMTQIENQEKGNQFPESKNNCGRTRMRCTTSSLWCGDH